MKTIGLFLTAEPSDGGMFQYSIEVLSALQALPRDEFSLVVAHMNPVWADHLTDISAERIALKPQATAPALALLWMASRMSSSSWRRWAPRVLGVVRRIVRQECDLWVFPRQDIWSSLFPVPSLAAIHDLMHRYELRFPEVSQGGRRRYRELYLRQLCHTARGILVDSQMGKQQVHDSYATPLEKLFVLPYVPPAYIYANRNSPGFEDRYALPPRYLFYPAQFWLHKNHTGLLRALALVREECPDVRLVLAGSKKHEYRQVMLQAESLGLKEHVSFLGYVPSDDMPELYRRARALILPTYFGPTNIPPLEAFVLSCPVAASNVYAMPEQLGDAALLFDPRSVEEMAACIRRLWTDDALCRRLVEKGRQRVSAWGRPEFQRRLHSVIRQLTS